MTIDESRELFGDASGATARMFSAAEALITAASWRRCCDSWGMLHPTRIVRYLRETK